MEIQRKINFARILSCVLLVSALAIVPFFLIGEDPQEGCCGGEMPVTHDMVMHLNQMQSFYRGLGSGRLYPRWQEETNRGFGAPTTIFYPPVIYYLSSLLFFLSRDWIITLQATYYLLMAASALAFYALARRIVGPLPAVLAMIVYLLAPYHLINHYQRGALAECLSFIWMPLVLLYARDLLLAKPQIDRAQEERIDQMEGGLRSLRGILEKAIRSEALWLSICWGLFIASHPPTAYQFLLIWAPVAIWSIISFRLWAPAGQILKAFVLGSMLAGAYIVPAILEQHHIHADDIERTWPYHESYVFLFDSARYDHLRDDFVLRLDFIWLFTALSLAIIGMAIKFCQARGLKLKEGIIWVGVGVYTSLMMTVLAKPVGLLIPKIEIGVFAWRMLTITTLVSAILTGYLIKAGRALRGVSGGGWVVLIAAGLFAAHLLISFRLVIWPMYRVEAFKPNPAHANFATAPRQSGRDLPLRGEVEWIGLGEAAIERWDPEYRRISLDLGQPASVSFRTFDFPGWTARVNGEPGMIARGSHGEISLNLPAGRQTVELELVNTPVRWFGGVLTMVAGVLIGAALLARALMKNQSRMPKGGPDE